jgi:hypothetical protein
MSKGKRAIEGGTTDLASLAETQVTATPAKPITPKPNLLRPQVANPLTYAKALESCAPSNATIPAVQVGQKELEKHAQEEATETSAEGKFYCCYQWNALH